MSGSSLCRPLWGVGRTRLCQTHWKTVIAAKAKAVSSNLTDRFRERLAPGSVTLSKQAAA